MAKDLQWYKVFDASFHGNAINYRSSNIGNETSDVNYCHVTNIDISTIKQVLNETDTSLSGLTKSDNVNWWSEFGPYTHAVNASKEIFHSLYTTADKKYREGNFAGYNHNAKSPSYTRTDVNEGGTVIVWRCEGSSSPGENGKLTIYGQVNIGEIDYRKLFSYQNPDHMKLTFHIPALTSNPTQSFNVAGSQFYLDGYDNLSALTDASSQIDFTSGTYNHTYDVSTTLDFRTTDDTMIAKFDYSMLNFKVLYKKKTPHVCLHFKDPWADNSIGCSSPQSVMHGGATFVSLNITGKVLTLKNVWVQFTPSYNYATDQIRYKTKVDNNPWSSVYTLSNHYSSNPSSDNIQSNFTLDQNPTCDSSIWVSFCSGNCSVQPDSSTDCNGTMA